MSSQNSSVTLGKHNDAVDIMSDQQMNFQVGSMEKITVLSRMSQRRAEEIEKCEELLTSKPVEV